MRQGYLRQATIFTSTTLVGLFAGFRLDSLSLPDPYPNLLVGIVGTYFLFRHGINRPESLTFVLALAIGVASYEYLFSDNPTTSMLGMP